MKYNVCIIVLLLISISILHAQDTIEVSSGWNMIGAISTRALNEFRSIPPGIIVSSFYGYQPGMGYIQYDTLKKVRDFG